MARITRCDGTGVDIPDDTPTTGHHGRQYCDDARPLAEEYLRRLDELHGETAIAFQARLEAIREDYIGKLRELPDAP